MAVPGAACGGDKENVPPAAAARGIAVRKQSAMKRPCGGIKKAVTLRRRAPLRDITGLFFLAASAPAVADAAAATPGEAPEPVRRGAPAAAAVEQQGRRSLRKGFR